MSESTTDRPQSRAGIGRGALLLGAVLAVAASAGGRLLGLAALVPLAVGLIAPWWFGRQAKARWRERGWLLATDGLVVALALVAAARGAATGAVAAWAAVVLLATLVGDRRRCLLAAGALGVVAAAMAPALGWWIEPLHVLWAPLLAASAWHFGGLGQALRAPREEADGREAEMWGLLEITDRITSTLDVGQVMHAIVERVGALADAPSCSILLVDGEAPSGFVLASKGHPEADMLPVNLDKYPEVRRALHTREPIVVDDVDRDPVVAPAREVLRRQGFRSLVVLPLSFGRETLGVLFLKSRALAAFTPRRLRFCKVAASISANALKNALLYRDAEAQAQRHRETGEKLRRVLDASPDLIVAADGRGRVVELNGAAEEITGRAIEGSAGRGVHELLGVAAETLSRIGKDPQDVTLRRADGTEAVLSLVSAPLRDASGDEVGRVWLGRDVTKLRQVEQSLIQAERLSSLGEVVAGVAHELNNPLSGVVGYAELLRANAQDPEQLADLRRIVESAMRCQKIVFKLLSFARKHPPDKRYQNLNDCVRKVLDLKSYNLRSSQILTELQLDADVPETCFDFHQIEQVVLNLLNNAEHAVTSGRRSGRIVLRTGSAGGQVWFEVADDGPGVPEAIRDRLFDPFYTTKPYGEGTGLGLSVSYGIVQEHRGRIELLPPEGESGARFRVWLPVVEGRRPEEVAPPDTPLAERPLAGRRVLVAEDEPLVLELFSRMLVADGAEVVLARDGEEAWDQLRQGRYDLVVADLLMPNLDGRQLYERVSEERPDLLRRFVFATGDLMREESVRFLEGLPNRILTKPLEVETVRRVLAQALDAA